MRLAQFAEKGVFFNHGAVATDAQSAGRGSRQRFGLCAQRPQGVDACCQECGCAVRDELGDLADKVDVVEACGFAQWVLGLEEGGGVGEVLGVVHLHGGNGASVEAVWFRELVWHFATEEAGTPYGFDYDESHNLSQVATADHVLEWLEVWSHVRIIQLVIPTRGGEHVLSKHATFCVDEHMCGLVKPMLWVALEFGVCKRRDRQVDRNVEAGPEYDCEPRRGIFVGTR